MSKQKSRKQPISQYDNPFGPRLFAPDLDGSAYKEFYKYRRLPDVQEDPHEHVKARAPDADPKRRRDLENAVKQLTPSDATSAKKRRITQKRTMASIFREFEAREFDGPGDWIYYKSFKDNLREVLADFLNHQTAGHLLDNRVLVPSGYQLSGRQIGGSIAIKPSGNLDQILFAALVWKSRRTLGLLWTLAEGNQHGALLHLAQTIVPFAKAVNEQAGANPKALGVWPQRLPVWPVMKSPHRDFDTDHRRLLKTLRIGAEFPFTIAEEARWTARDPIGKWAIHLCQTIEIMIVSDYAAEELSEMWKCKIDYLGSFSGKSWENWWTAAKALLTCEYADVVDILELNHTVKSPTDRRSPGRIRKRIFQALKDKFKSMAFQNKV
jgi:hypothetical protein